MRRLLFLPILTLATPALSDAALLLGTDRYDQLGRVSRGAEIIASGDELAALGFEVQAMRNGTAEQVEGALEVFVDEAEGADRLVAALTGRFVTDGARTWYLTVDAQNPRLFGLGDEAVSVESLMRVLSELPGRAILLLGDGSDGRTAYGSYLRAGIGPLDVPQGVTVFRGEPRDIADFMEDAVAEPGADLVDASEDEDLTAEGFVPDRLTFIPATAARAPDRDGRSDARSDAERAEEDRLWAAAERDETLEGYQRYLAAYPLGRYADEAEARVQEILAEPFRDARLSEEALDLTRDERRDIQRDLSLLGYNTRGIDGIFGPGTRGAITNWQQQNGYPQTSYMTAEQISRLDAQAARRAAELEAEAERQRQQELRVDRAYWEETGARGDEAGYRAYLDRFPEGQFAEIARENLQAIEEEKRAVAEAQDRAAWDRAREADIVPAYRRYLAERPEGAFRSEAQARIEALTRAEGEEAGRQQARAEEEALGLNPLTARLVEVKLADLGLDPGPVDGRFDERTRRALREYQRDRGLPATGFLNERTVVRLLADAVVGFQ